MAGNKTLNKGDIERLLSSLSDELRRKNVSGRVCLAGGAAIVLAFRSRESTTDLDGVFEPSNPVREAVRAIADREGLDTDWLNDAAKTYFSEQSVQTNQGMPQYSNLEVLRVDDKTLLAMKIRSARVSLSSDLQDSVTLVRHLKLRNKEEIFEVLKVFFPEEHCEPKTQYFVEEVLENAWRRS